MVGAGAGALNSSSADSLVTVHQLQRLGRPLGRSLRVAQHTIKNRVSCVLRKLGMDNRGQAGMFAATA